MEPALGQTARKAGFRQMLHASGVAPSSGSGSLYALLMLVIGGCGDVGEGPAGDLLNDGPSAFGSQESGESSEARLGETGLSQQLDGGTSTAGGGPPVGACFDVSELEPCTAFSNALPSSKPKYGEVLDASSFGPSASLVMFGGLAVLARSADGPDAQWKAGLLHVVQGQDRIETRVSVLPVPLRGAGADAVVRAVWGNDSLDPIFGVDVLALVCDGDGCEIFGADSAADTALRPLFDVALKGQRPVVGGLILRSGRLCVYGEGIYCHDNTAWAEEVSAAEAPGVRDLAMDTVVVAVGDDGLVLVEEDEGWRTVDVPDADPAQPFLRATSREGHLNLLQAGGLWFSGQVDSLVGCRQDPPLVAASGLGSSAPSVAQAVMDSEGTLVRYSWDVRAQRPGFCFDGTIPLKEPAIDFTQFACRAATNLMVLTEHKVMNILSEQPVCILVAP
ncbi:MAG: hypothetical protein OXR73_24950 [Myxococcales bacterium]|nr:hypothetical protein [Myxococcales bacterium]